MKLIKNLQESAHLLFYNKRNATAIEHEFFSSKLYRNNINLIRFVSNNKSGLIRINEKFGIHTSTLMFNILPDPSYKYTELTKNNFIHVAIFTKFKDYDTLFLAVKQLKTESTTPFKVFIFGGFYSQEEYQITYKKIKFYDIEDNIVLQINGSSSNYNFITPKAGILSSLSEGFSNTLLEYLSNGLPVITTNIEPNINLLGSEYRPHIFTPEKPHELVSFMKEIMNNNFICKHLYNLSIKRFKQLKRESVRHLEHLLIT